MPDPTPRRLDDEDRRPLWQRAARWMRERGWRYSPAQLLEVWAERSFDQRHGTDTSRFAELRSLKIASPNKRQGERYQPSPVRSLRHVLRRLDIDFASRTFIDYGCGKGRTLLLAGELPFERIIGIDFSPELAACATRNIERFHAADTTGKRSHAQGQTQEQTQAHTQGQARARTSVVVRDATEYDVPPGDLVLYFFKPFTDEILARVMTRVAASLHAQPRPVTLVYLYLDTPALVEAAGFRLRWAWRRYRVFEGGTG